MKKLLILDCDWVLYSPSELDVNAMVYAFNDACDELGYQKYKFTRVEHCTDNKPVKWFYNYIRYVTDLLNIDMNEFIDKMLNTVDYSHIKRDSECILEILEKLQSNYEICICTNNHRKHLDNVLIAKYWVNSEDFPYPCFDVTFAENDWRLFLFPLKCNYWKSRNNEIAKYDLWKSFLDPLLTEQFGLLSCAG